jgi:hypothetical protein
MTQLANITVFDGAATPVSHSLTATSLSRDKDGTTALWRENSFSVPLEAQIYASMRLQALKNRVWRSELRVVVPTMESVSGQNSAGYTAAPKVAFEDMYVLAGFHSARSTVSSRRLARMFIVNIANNVSTSVAASSSGPYPELTESHGMGI